MVQQIVYIGAMRTLNTRAEIFFWARLC